MTQMNADEETGKVRLRALNKIWTYPVPSCFLTYLRSSASSVDKSVLRLARLGAGSRQPLTIRAVGIRGDHRFL